MSISFARGMLPDSRVTTPSEQSRKGGAATKKKFREEVARAERHLPCGKARPHPLRDHPAVRDHTTNDFSHRLEGAAVEGDKRKGTATPPQDPSHSRRARTSGRTRTLRTAADEDVFCVSLFAFLVFTFIVSHAVATLTGVHHPLRGDLVVLLCPGRADSSGTFGERPVLTCSSCRDAVGNMRPR